MPIRRQAIIWTSDSFAYWSTYASLRLDRSSFTCVVGCIEMIMRNRICAFYTENFIVHSHITVIISMTRLECQGIVTPLPHSRSLNLMWFCCQLDEPYGFPGDHSLNECSNASMCLLILYIYICIYIYAVFLVIKLTTTPLTTDWV